jgi:hypothetical protein
VFGTVTVRTVVFELPIDRVSLFGAREAEGELVLVGETVAVRATVPANVLRLLRVTTVEESDVPLKTVREPADFVIV